MPLIPNLLNKLKKRKERINELEEDYNANKKLQDKQLSANERELNSYKEENRQRMINRMLESERKKRFREWSNGNQILKERNIFNHSPNIFKNQKRLFKL